MQDIIFSSSHVHAAIGHSDFTKGGGVASSYATDERGQKDIESSKKAGGEGPRRVEETRKKRVESIESSGSELVREWEEKQSMFATTAFSSFLRRSP